MYLYITKGYLVIDLVLIANEYSKSNDEIIKLLVTDYKQAFTFLYKEYFTMCAYFVTKNSGSKEEAKDVFQDAMIVMFKNSRKDNFELTCNIKTYLYSIIRNLWLKQLQHKNKRINIIDYEKYVQITTDDISVKKDETLFDTMYNSMQKLGENCQKILHLFYFEKKSMEVIAQELEYTNAENAKTQKYKCLQQLKKYFNEKNV